MAYTQKDAKREVGDSKDWLVGLEASIKKWEQRVRGDVDSYNWKDPCGLCFVKRNRKQRCPDCPAQPICRLTHNGPRDKEVLQALKNLRKEMNEMDCKDKCANYKPIEVERPTDHPGRIFAEDLRVGMVIRRRGTQHQRKLIVILGEVEDRSVPCLQLLADCEPYECNMWVAAAGLAPYSDSGKWEAGAWCEEVT